VRNCLHAACVGFPACVQTVHVPLCGAFGPVTAAYRTGDELRDIFSADFPEYEVDNPTIQPGTNRMTATI
jgi:hypothetical protein